jgi:hypothetical protein
MRLASDEQQAHDKKIRTAQRKPELMGSTGGGEA